MPYLKGSPPKEELNIVKLWVHSGGFKFLTEKKIKEEKPSWYYQSFNRSSIKQGTSINKNEIDIFLKDQLPSQILSPAEQLKKLKLSLTGLFPSNQEIRDIVQKNKNYEDFVEEYLSSPYFGLQLANYWMDLTGFSEEAGNGKSGYLEGANQYKLNLMKEFNQDTPYFKLLSHQIVSADSPLSIQKGQTFFSFIQADDDPYTTGDLALNTVFQLSLGIEMKCARCHDHPHEPISNENYYLHLNVFKNWLDFKDITSIQYRKETNSEVSPNYITSFRASSSEMKRWSILKTPFNVDAFTAWLVDTQNGTGQFTSRMFVDHIWRNFFGKSLILDEDFLISKGPPHHLNLMNWLAWDFIENRTTPKHLIRKIVTSRAFRSPAKSCEHSNASSTAWACIRKIHPESIRDGILLKANLLNSDIKGMPQPVLLANKVGDSSKDAKNLRSFFYVRVRVSENFLTKYFDVPKGFGRRLLRENRPTLDEIYFLSTSSYLSTITDRLKDKYKNIRQKHQMLIEEIYLDFLSRYPSKNELIFWENHFQNKNFEQNLDIAIHSIPFNNECIYLR